MKKPASKKMPVPIPKTTLKQKIALGVFAVCLTLVALEILLRLGGTLFYVLQVRRNTDFNAEEPVYRIMCIGESTTALGGESSYPSQLEEILNQKSAPHKFKVINCGMPSATTGTILSRFEENINRYRPDCIVAMIGANDTEYFRLPSGVAGQLGYLLEQSRALKLFKYLYLHIRQSIIETTKSTDGPHATSQHLPRKHFFQDLAEVFVTIPSEIESLLKLITTLENKQKEFEKLANYFREKGLDNKVKETESRLKENKKKYQSAVNRIGSALS